jgi:hypothetical protein
VDFARILRLLFGFLDQTRTPWGLIGGLAMAVYGSARTTLDVDIVVDAGIQDSLIAFLEGQGYETLHRSSGYSNHLHAEPDLGRVDVVYVRSETSRELFENVERHPGPEGLEIPVPRPEHLAAMKAYSIRNDPARKLRELADIRVLLDASGADRSEIESYFVRYGLEELVDELE